MKDFFKTLSRGTIAFLAIAVAIVIIILKDPPHNICHSERDQFLAVQSKFIKADPQLKKAFKNAKTPQQRLYASCNESRNSGGCLEYFIKLKKFVSDFAVISRDCKKTAAKHNLILKTLKDSTSLLVQLAWGDSDTIRSAYKKFSWLDQSDIGLFCKLKNNLQQSIPQSVWESFREETMLSLPGSENLSREQLWKSSMLSVPCDKVL